MKSALPAPCLFKGSFEYYRPRVAPPTPMRTVPPRASIAELEARIRRYNSDIDASSSTFRAAVLLLAGIEYGLNIDALSHRTSYPRAFVAQCARRLIDNGVWRDGRIVSDWSPADEASGAFWNDVAVAEGKLCRRETADGEIEWAPPGYWNKTYDFIDSSAGKRLGTTYRDPAPVAAQNGGPAAVAASDEHHERDSVAPSASAEPTLDSADAATPDAPSAETPVTGPEPRSNGSTESPPERRPMPAPRKRVHPPAEIFPGVAWLGS